MYSKAARRSLFFAGLLLIPALALTACGDDGTTDPSGGPVLGQWGGIDSSTGLMLYFDIGSDMLVVYHGVPGHCFARNEYDILDQNGSMYTLQWRGDATAQPFTLSFVRNGNQLTVNGNGTHFVLTQSQTDLSGLDLCLQGAGDPSFTCSSLPALQPGDSVVDALTDSDYAWVYAYFDPYQITVDNTTSVDITLHSSEFDPYLYLYDAAGNLVAYNDDAGMSTRDSELVRTLQPGCYRVEVTSYYMFETGSYTLQVQ